MVTKNANSPLSGISLAALSLLAFAAIGTALVSWIAGNTEQRIADNERAYLLRNLNALVPHERYDNDFFTDATGTRPGWGALFSLNMLIHTEGGRNYRLDEGETFLREAGFSEIHSRGLSAHATLLVGQKS